MALGATIGELKGRMSNREFNMWLAYYRIAPWGEERADLRSGIISATVAQAAGNKAKAEDFMPLIEDQPKRMSVSDMDRQIEMIWATSDLVRRGG